MAGLVGQLSPTAGCSGPITVSILALEVRGARKIKARKQMMLVVYTPLIYTLRFQQNFMKHKLKGKACVYTKLYTSFGSPASTNRNGRK